MSAKYPSSTATVKDIHEVAADYLTPSLIKRKTASIARPNSLLVMAVLLGLSCIVCCTEATKAIDKKDLSPIASANSPSKEAQQAAWDKILPLISNRHGYVEPHEVEKALGIKLKASGSEIIKLTVNMRGYMARPSSALPLQVNLLMFKDLQNKEQNPWSGFEVFFRDRYTPEGLSTPCLPAKQILQDLHQHGWRTQGPDLPEPGRIKGNTSLIAKNAINDYIVQIATDSSLCLDSVSVYDKAKQ